MHGIDIGVFLFLRSFAGHWPRLDFLANLLTDNDVLKAGPVLVAIWALWFVRDAKVDERRVRLVSMLIAGCGAALFSVWLTRILPMRLRPVFEPSLSYAFAVHEGTPDWSRVSSLPSDHAAMFTALACGLMFVSRKWGLLMLLHAFLFVMLPRAYVGLHYFWDLVAGALIGAVFAWACNTEFVRSRVARPLIGLEASYTPAFYGVMFLLTYQIADLFHSTRQILGAVSSAGAVVAHNFGLAVNAPAVPLAPLAVVGGVGLVALVLKRKRWLG